LPGCLRGSQRSRCSSASYRVGRVPKDGLEPACHTGRETVDNRWAERSVPRRRGREWVPVYRDRWSLGHPSGGAGTCCYLTRPSIALIYHGSPAHAWLRQPTPSRSTLKVIHSKDSTSGRQEIRVYARAQHSCDVVGETTRTVREELLGRQSS